MIDAVRVDVPRVAEIRTKEREKRVNGEHADDSLDASVFPTDIALWTPSAATGVSTENVHVVLLIPVA